MYRKSILLTFLLSLFVASAYSQTYPKEKGAIRILTYNSHYCKGSTEPGEISKKSTQRLAEVIKALNPDVVSIQELDSASTHRGSRYLLKDIADATGLDLIPIYGNAAPFDNGSIGCGALVHKKMKIKGVEKIHLPGDEPRIAIVIKMKKMTFVATHSDLNDELRKQGARLVCNKLKDAAGVVFLAGDLNDSHYWDNGGISFPIWTDHFNIISNTSEGTIPGRSKNSALIDYVLLLKNREASKVKVIQTKIVKNVAIGNRTVNLAEVSDHYPVFVDIRL